MGSGAPLAIGTRGTVGSLVRREIDYFKRLDLECASGRSKTHQEATNSKTAAASTTCAGNFSMMTWMKKKRRSNNNGCGRSFLPSMCSAVDVSQGNTFYKLPDFTYRTLQADMELDL